MSCRERRGGRLERRPRFIEVVQILDPELGDDNQAAGENLEQSFMGETLQRLAQRSPPDPEPRLQLVLTHPGAGRQLETQHQVLDC
jgi:hypothetical protein